MAFFNLVDHLSLGTNDLDAAIEFYDAVMAVIGGSRQHEIPGTAVAYGVGFPEFWVQRPLDQQVANSGNGVHIALHVQKTSQVDEFHRVALSKGGHDAGAPGLRPEYAEGYYAAYVYDLDGHKIEAVYMPVYENI